MEKYRKLASQWILISGVLVLILGIAHNVATTFIMKGFNCLPEEKFRIFIFMFVATGTSLILTGIATIICSTQLEKPNTSAYSILLLCTVFIILIGAGATAAMPGNQFAQATGGAAIIHFLPLVLFRKLLLGKSGL